jgi:hypothetical protein
MTKLERGLVQRSLLYCLERGYFSLIRYLLESGLVNARERDSEGRTGLIYCCFINDDSWAQNMAMILLEKGAQVEDHDQRGLNALHYAIITQRIILVRRYLDSLDFDLNHSIDIHGNTCLHYACSTGNTNIVRSVLDAMKRYSLDLTVKNHSGLTACDVAYQLNFQHCQNLLRNEIELQERNNSAKISIKPLFNRHLSVPDRKYSTASSSYCTGSNASLPYFLSSSSSLRKRYQNTLNFTNENLLYPPAKFIDPIESHIIAFKRNECLDASLVKQVKKRPDFAPSPLTSSSTGFASSSLASSSAGFSSSPLTSTSAVFAPSSLASSSTVFDSSSTLSWREDVPKIFDQLQILKSHSYRKSVHPPLDTELPVELLDRLHGIGDINGIDYSRSRALSLHPTDSFQKIVRKQRITTNTVKAFNKKKK